MKKCFRIAVNVAFSLLICACSGEIYTKEAPSEEAIVVGLNLGGNETKSSVGSDGVTVSWNDGDEVALWAQRGSSNILTAQKFSVYGSSAARGFFTSTLSSAMAEGSYTYYAAYPYPEKVSGTSASFRLPSTQDGRASSGADIMISDPVTASALEPLQHIEDHSGLSMKMNHLVHLFRFYIPFGTDPFNGEKIQKIEISFPKDVVGTVTADVKNPSGSMQLTDGRKVLTLDLAEPLAPSQRNKRSYAYAAFFPSSFSDGDVLNIRIFTESKVSTLAPISLKGRKFTAGHATSVMLSGGNIASLFKLYFKIASNNLGEDVQSVTLTAPEGCNWGNGSNVMTIDTGRSLGAGDSFTLEIEDEVAYRGLSNTDVTVTYDSEHVTCSEVVTLPPMYSGSSTDIALNVPWLLFEDFSTIGSISSNDGYSMSSAGDKGAVSFLGGWTGGRVGASEGQSVRLACRRETSADYPARLDSRPLPVIKKPVDVDVSFDYGADNKYGGLAIITDGNVGQTLHLGYVTSTKAYSSGAGDGVFDDDNSFYIKEYTGSYTNLPHNATMTIKSLPAGETDRITWRTTIEHQAGTTNTTAWFYIDNVKVKVSSGK